MPEREKAGGESRKRNWVGKNERKTVVFLSTFKKGQGLRGVNGGRTFGRDQQKGKKKYRVPHRF